MRFLHVIQRYWPFHGGSEGYFQDLSEELVRRGHQVAVFTTDAWDLEHFWAPGKRTTGPAQETHNGVEIRRFPVERPPLPPIYFRALRRIMAEGSDLSTKLHLNMERVLALGSRFSPRVPALARAMRELPAGAYDLVHTTNITLEAPILAAYRFSKRTHTPHLITPFIHLGVAGERRILRYYTMQQQIALLKRATKVIVQTGLEGQALINAGVSPQRIEKVSVGIHPERLQGGDGARFRAAQGLASDTPLVLFVGAIALDKGANTLVEAMRRLWRAGSAARLVLIGATMLEDFRPAYDALGAEERDKVLLLGFVEEQTKLDAYAAANVYAMPSRTDTFGVVYLEAWLYDKPVIGARAGGVPEVISDGVDGYLIEFGDSAALAEKIASLIADPALAERMGRAGHEKVLREHTWALKMDRLVEIYEECVRTSGQ